MVCGLPRENGDPVLKKISLQAPLGWGTVINYCFCCCCSSTGAVISILVKAAAVAALAAPFSRGSSCGAGGGTGRLSSLVGAGCSGSACLISNGCVVTIVIFGSCSLVPAVVVMVVVGLIRMVWALEVSS